MPLNRDLECAVYQGCPVLREYFSKAIYKFKVQKIGEIIFAVVFGQKNYVINENILYKKKLELIMESCGVSKIKC